MVRPFVCGRCSHCIIETIQPSLSQGPLWNSSRACANLSSFISPAFKESCSGNLLVVCSKDIFMCENLMIGWILSDAMRCDPIQSNLPILKADVASYTTVLAMFLDGSRYHIHVHVISYYMSSTKYWIIWMNKGWSSSFCWFCLSQIAQIIHCCRICKLPVV